MNFNKLLSIILITFTVLLCNINLCLGNNTQNTSIAINPMGLPDIDPMTNPATDNWLTREVARQVNKDDVTQLTQYDFNRVDSIYKDRENITVIPKEIGNLHSLYMLVLSYNNITTIPNELCNLTKLDTLRIGYNQIQEIPDNFYNLTQLKGLTLSNNNIDFISNKIGNLTNLFDLDMSYNNLKTVPPEIGKLKSLNSLYLNDNNLEFIPPEIGNLTKLSSLKLDKNYLISVPKEISNLKYTRISIANQEKTLSKIICTEDSIKISNPLKCFENIVIPHHISNLGKYDNKSNIIFWKIDNSIKEVNFKFNESIELIDYPSFSLFFTGTVTIPIISDEDAIALNAEIQKAKDLLESDDVTSDKLIESISGLSNAITVYEKSHSNK